MTISVPDPRSFALHKMWISERQDRDPPKRGRDRDQALLIAHLLQLHLPHLQFDDPALQALPLKLRQKAEQLKSERNPTSLEPDW